MSTACCTIVMRRQTINWLWTRERSIVFKRINLTWCQLCKTKMKKKQKYYWANTYNVWKYKQSMKNIFLTELKHAGYYFWKYTFCSSAWAVMLSSIIIISLPVIGTLGQLPWFSTVTLYSSPWWKIYGEEV